MQKQDAYKTLTREQQRFWKRILIVDDDNGFELCEKIFAIDINVRVCLMSSGEINWEALREMYPTRQEGCFIRKPVTIDYLVKRIRSELD